MPTPTPLPTYVLLYVRSPAASAAFYTALLGRAPVEQSPTFALFVLTGGHKLGLWLREGVVPPAPPGAPDLPDAAAFELAIAVDDPEAVDALHGAWGARRVPIALAPAALDFGYTFVALDPDGHRVRVFAPTEAPAGAPTARARKRARPPSPISGKASAPSP